MYRLDLPVWRFSDSSPKPEGWNPELGDYIYFSNLAGEMSIELYGGLIPISDLFTSDASLITRAVYLNYGCIPPELMDPLVYVCLPYINGRTEMFGFESFEALRYHRISGMKLARCICGKTFFRVSYNRRANEYCSCECRQAEQRRVSRLRIGQRDLQNAMALGQMSSFIAPLRIPHA